MTDEPPLQNQEEDEFDQDPFVAACRKLAPQPHRTSRQTRDQIFQAYRAAMAEKKDAAAAAKSLSHQASQRSAGSWVSRQRMWLLPWVQIPVAACAGFLLASVILPLKTSMFKLEEDREAKELDSRSRPNDLVPKSLDFQQPESVDKQKLLTEISRLVLEGKLDEAQAKIYSFRERFPDK